MRQLRNSPASRRRSKSIVFVWSLTPNCVRKNPREEDLNRRVEDYLKEVGQLREQNKKLEIEMSKVARVGKLEEMDFAEEAKTWPGIYCSEKLPQHGDYILAFRDASGAHL